MHIFRYGFVAVSCMGCIAVDGDIDGSIFTPLYINCFIKCMFCIPAKPEWQSIFTGCIEATRTIIIAEHQSTRDAVENAMYLVPLLKNFRVLQFIPYMQRPWAGHAWVLAAFFGLKILYWSMACKGHAKSLNRTDFCKISTACANISDSFAFYLKSVAEFWHDTG